ncbi:ATP-binding protein [Ruegeria sp. Ofav3-42]|nr:ATP-binding protein [Ruegeria sp. Ofav3-42]MCG7522755.1 ATP-binding protein [Ruegeria sp. Ofav3-42]
MAPPWKEILVDDAERRHDLETVVQEHRRITDALDAFGYHIEVFAALCFEPAPPSVVWL